MVSLFSVSHLMWFHCAADMRCCFPRLTTSENMTTAAALVLGIGGTCGGKAMREIYNDCLPLLYFSSGFWVSHPNCWSRLYFNNTFQLPDGIHIKGTVAFTELYNLQTGWCTLYCILHVHPHMVHIYSVCIDESLFMCIHTWPSLQGAEVTHLLSQLVHDNDGGQWRALTWADETEEEAQHRWSTHHHLHLCMS